MTTNTCANGRADDADLPHSPRVRAALDAAPVEHGDEVLVHQVPGVPGFETTRYRVVSITPARNLAPHRNDFLLRAYHENPPYMAEGCGDSVLLLQERRGDQWEVPDDE